MEKVTIASLIAAMKSCDQMPGLTILQHGIAVRERYADLIGHLRDGRPLSMEWRLPPWTSDKALLENLPSDATMARYHLFHDCGKPAVLTVDSEGRRHFPDHAAKSSDLWRRAGGEEQVADLIAMDMDIHLLKGEGTEAFARRPQARALLLTGLAEIHANAEMFGGCESVGFKIKLKHIERRGKAILKTMAALTPTHHLQPAGA